MSASEMEVGLADMASTSYHDGNLRQALLDRAVELTASAVRFGSVLGWQGVSG